MLSEHLTLCAIFLINIAALQMKRMSDSLDHFYESGRPGTACCSPVHYNLVNNLTQQFVVNLVNVHQLGVFSVCS